jgi:hypothetical protein
MGIAIPAHTNIPDQDMASGRPLDGSLLSSEHIQIDQG